MRRFIEYALITQQNILSMPRNNSCSLTNILLKTKQTFFKHLLGIEILYEDDSIHWDNWPSK